MAESKPETTAAAAQGPAPAPAKPEPEKQTNCPACNKPIKKLKRYYRDGKFYCSKKCWKKSIKAKQEKTKDADK